MTLLLITYTGSEFILWDGTTELERSPSGRALSKRAFGHYGADQVRHDYDLGVEP